MTTPTDLVERRALWLRQYANAVGDGPAANCRAIADNIETQAATITALTERLAQAEAALREIVDSWERPYQRVVLMPDQLVRLARVLNAVAQDAPEKVGP